MSQFINIFGVAVVALMMIPNIAWAMKNRDAVNRCENRLVNTLEQIGRYGSMLSISLNFWIFEAGFRSDESFAAWLVATAALLLAYYVCWALYFAGRDARLALAVIPSVIFLFSGVMMRNLPLVIFGLIFTPAHIYVTQQNRE